ASVELTLLKRAYVRHQRLTGIRRFARPLTEGLPPLLSTREELAPIPELGNAAAGLGFFDNLPMGDGMVRYMPLWIEHYGRIYPQVGLALACATLGVKIDDVQINPDGVVIPAPDGRRIEIPTQVRSTTRGRAAQMAIPWFGVGDWMTMYDHPAHRQSSQHVPI